MKESIQAQKMKSCKAPKKQNTKKKRKKEKKKGGGMSVYMSLKDV